SGVRRFTPFWFSVEPTDTLAVRSSPAVLNCSAQSDSLARVEWKKDGTFLNLASDDRRQLLADGSLLITSVVHSKHNKPDEGVYQCVASVDTLGTISSRTARLSVAGKRHGTIQHTPWEGGWVVCRGERQDCRAPAFAYESSLFPFSPSVCLAEEEARTDKFIERGIISPLGSVALFVFRIRCLPVLASFNMQFLSLSPALVSQAESKILSSLESINWQCNSHEICLPRFTSQPEAATVFQGDSEVMSCEVNLDLVPFTRWELNKAPVELSSRVVVLPSGALVISNASEADAGLYRCVVENVGVPKTSEEAELQVLPENEVERRLKFLRQPVPVTKVIGQSVLLPCVATGYPTPTVTWMLGEKPIEESEGRFELIGGGNLQILNLTEEDAGIYSCLASNVNETAEVQAELTIQGQLLGFTNRAEARARPPGPLRALMLAPPMFLKKPANIYAYESMDIIFECEVTGRPPPTVKWVKNGDAVIPSDYFKIIKEHNLQVLGLVKSDEGFYQCLAENDVGNVQASAQLIILDHDVAIPTPPPTSLTSATTDHVAPGTSGGPTPSAPRDVVASLVSTRFIKLTWRPPAEPHGDNITYSVYYSLEGTSRERIENTTRPGELQVNIHNLMPDTKYVFRVAAHNKNGLGESSTPLKVATQPEVQVPGPAPNLQAVATSPTSVTVSWEMPLTGNGEIQNYKLYYMEKGMGNEQDIDVAGLSYTMNGLKKFTEYSFRVVAYNKHGPGVSTADVVAQTYSDVPSAAPQNLTLEVLNSKVRHEKKVTPGVLFIIHLFIHAELYGSPNALCSITHINTYVLYADRCMAFSESFEGWCGIKKSRLTALLSIMVRWQPPPPGTQNGEITGYKIRYRKVVRKSEIVESTIGAQLFQLIEGLERGTEYTVRVAAITVNGTGPPTEWGTAETFESDLDETRVPDIPSSLHVRPLVTSIVVSWTPPENQNIVVRGYAIGYGIGSPHAQTIRVDYKQRYYTIENLDPSSHYVITLKAFNNIGEGIPVYESAATRPLSDPLDPEVDLYDLFNPPYTPVPDPSPMLPPVGVQASVLSHDTIKVTWADNSLPKNQKITDARYYTVRWKTNIPANTKYKFTACGSRDLTGSTLQPWYLFSYLDYFLTANTTNLSHMVTGLKPNTLYEFSVMVTKGRRMSTWSMTAHGTTFETTPNSPPKDVTVVSKEGRPRTIIVNWQPPSEANGKITGYIIYYSTNVNAEVHDWVVEPVVGNRLTHQIQELTLDTPYYFKIQARNSKGMGPMSEAVQFRTPKAESSDKMANDQASGSSGRPAPPNPNSENGFGPPIGKPGHSGSPTQPLDNSILLIIIISVGAFTIIIVVIVAVMCTRRTTSQQKKKRAACKSANGSHKYKGNSKDLKPPDLWIHHERLELKPIDKSPEPNPVMTDTPIPRTSQDITPVDSTMDNTIHQRRNSYRGHESEDSMSTLAGRRGMRPKMMMPFDAQPPQPVISAHPIHSLDNHHHHYHSGSLASPTRSYLHHQINPRPLATPISHIDRANSAESVRNTPSADPLPVPVQPACTVEHPEPDSATSFLSAPPEEEPSYNPPTAHVRPTHPLKSFAVPAVPSSNPTFESPALPSTPLLTQTGPASQLHSVKTASIGTLGRTRTPMPVTVPSAPDVPETSKMLEDAESVSTAQPGHKPTLLTQT
ncbi:NEO1 protein, partial [Amia calva]|nr:NEO1 protein [Amia calva]